MEYNFKNRFNILNLIYFKKDCIYIYLYIFIFIWCIIYLHINLIYFKIDLIYFKNQS